MAQFETTIGDELTVLVSYDLDKGQRQILYPNDSAQPGIEAEITITAVNVGDADLFDDLSQGCMNKLELEAWDNEGLE